MCVATRLRLGLPPTEDMPDHCRACDERCDLQLDPWHFLACRGLTKQSVHRHTILVSSLCDWANKLGCIVRREPRDLRDGSNDRPDIDIEIGDKRYLVDVTVRHPCAPSHAASSSRCSLAAARAAEKEKNRKYEEMARLQKATFVPFAVETFGGMGDCASDFVKQLISEGRKHAYVWAPYEIVYGIQHSVAVAIQRGNAAMLSVGLHRSRDIV